jgi:hypothetical protein
VDGGAVEPVVTEAGMSDISATKCELYHPDLSGQELEAIKSTMRSALETYSVSQRWSVAWTEEIGQALRS